MAQSIKKNFISDSTIDLLSKFEILKNLTKGELKKLLRGKETDYEASIAKLIRYEPNEVVIREGDFDSWTFWVVKGIYKVVVGGSVITNISTPGDIFGEMSVLEGIPRTASVVSVEDGICLGIDMSILGNLNDEYITHVISFGFKQKKLERINETRTQLIKEKQELDIKYTNMLKLERTLRKKESEFAVKDTDLSNKELEIATRESKIIQRENQLNQRENQLEQRENQLKQIENQLEQRKNQLEQRENQLKQIENHLEQIEN